MKHVQKAFVLLLLIALLAPTYAVDTKPDSTKTPRPIELQDILAWKNITSTALSNNGDWFAYQVAPNKGDSEIIIKQTKGDSTYKFSIGEKSRSSIKFSEDSKWVAFYIYPTEKEKKKLKKLKKKSYNKAALVELATGEKVEFENVKRFSFSNENPNWLILHKYQPESQTKDKDKWSGSDLILHELIPKKQFNIGNVSEFSLDKKGRWLAWIIDAQGLGGNGVQLRILKTGIVKSLDNDTTVYKGLNWTEEGTGLAVLKGRNDKKYEDKLYSLVGFKNFDKKSTTKVTYDPSEDETFPDSMTISPNRNPLWTDELNGILFGIHEVKLKEDKNEKAKEKVEKKEETEIDSTKAEADSTKKSKKKKPKIKPDKEDIPELVIWHWKDKRMQSMQQVQEKRDKNFSYLCIYRVDKKKFIRLANDNLKRVSAAPKHKFAIGFDNSEYELAGNLEGRRYQDIYVFDLKTGERKLALKKSRWYNGPSPDGTHFLFYEKGDYYTYDMRAGQKYNITKNVATSFIDKERDLNIIDPPIRPVGWAKDGVSVLLYDNWDVWNVPVHGGNGKNLTVDGKEKKIRYRRRFRLDPEEKGIDLKKPVYFGTYGEWTKKAGFARVDKGKPGAKMLLWHDAGFSRLLKAKHENVFLYTKETNKDYPEYGIADGSLQKRKKITDVGKQQKDFLWTEGSKLIDYVSDKDDKLQAALLLPANYEEGKSYPTVVYIYEKLSQRLNRYSTLSTRGFTIPFYLSNGYAVLMPDITYKINDPGLSAVWCVLPALKAAIKTGVVDRKNVAIHGHSWGGYQTSFLITQTDAFKCAVAGAPLTNLISMYSSIYWNSGSANQPIFESSQGRFKGGYWENLDAYTRNSPVYYAQNVNTPLLLLHNDKDGAVDWNQGIEYFNTLRRLEKPVVMLQYKGENHGVRKPSNREDYTVRMKEFFDFHLKGKPAPEWLENGIPHLKQKESFEERVKKRMEDVKKKKGKSKKEKGKKE
jgi:dipeptidyl aminopeptidase/acylaminoacyl peptidase